MIPSLQKSVRLAISASVLLAFAVPFTAHAASEIYINDSYFNKESGVQLYSVGQVDGNTYDHAVVTRQPDGSYAKWQEPFTFFWKCSGGELQLSGNDDPELSYVYDVHSQSIVRKSSYVLSPDGKWGTLERSRYVWVAGAAPGSGHTAKFHDYYLKNMTTGTTSIYHSSEGRYGAFWIGQHTLLENGYKEDAKQNVIATYDASTGQRQELLKGSMQNWNPSTEIIQYTKNEPKRLPWIYSLKSGASRLITNYDELKKLFPASPSSSTPVVQLPKDIVLKDLPVMEVPVKLMYEYSVKLDGQNVEVSTVFTKNGITWIPVKPLAATLGWSLDVQDRSTAAAKSGGYRYTVASGNANVILTPLNSYVSANRLYMTQVQLKQLGYSSVVFTPLL